MQNQHLDDEQEEGTDDQEQETEHQQVAGEMASFLTMKTGNWIKRAKRECIASHPATCG